MGGPGRGDPAFRVTGGVETTRRNFVSLESLSKMFNQCVCKIKCVKTDEKQNFGGRLLSRSSSLMKIPGDAAGRDEALNKLL